MDGGQFSGSAASASPGGVAELTDQPAREVWEIDIRPTPVEVDREGLRVQHAMQTYGIAGVARVRSARVFLVEGALSPEQVESAARTLLADPVTEDFRIRSTAPGRPAPPKEPGQLLTVLLKPGVTDNAGQTAAAALRDLGLPIEHVHTARKYWFHGVVQPQQLRQVASRILANEAIERLVGGLLELETLAIDRKYELQLKTIPLRELSDEGLAALSLTGQLYLSLVEMQTIQQHFRDLGRDPTDIELETVAQTWSEHCSHKTLAGRVRYVDDRGERQFQNMLKETIFAATQTLRQSWGSEDWCVSVFRDNAGVVKFDEQNHVCFKVETHNHPSAIEPYGGANTGLGGVIRDPLGTGLGAKPVCNTNVFCFAPPNTKLESLPPGVLHPQVVARGVVAGVRDYGNRMGIPTVNGAVFFDERYLGNPLVYCGTVAIMPVDKCDKEVVPGDYIVAVGGRTGRDGIHGATFSSAELTQESEVISGGAVQIGNAIAEKMMHDVLLQARDAGLYHAITDCGAGGFSSAVGEMGAECGAEVWLDQAPLKYAGLSYTEIWISEAQERMVLAVPPESWDAFRELCAREGVEASRIGQFTETGKLVLKYQGHDVGQLTMAFLHDGRPPVVREAVYTPPAASEPPLPPDSDFGADLKAILGSLNVCSKEWIIRQYDHEVQSGSVIKPLVGVECDGPSDAAVVQPDLRSPRGLVIANGMNPRFGDLDPYWMAAAAIDEAVRNCVAVGADPTRIAILDNFCWGNTDRPETLGSLVRAAIGCHDTAVAFRTPFISGKDSLNNEFSYRNAAGEKVTVAIPASLLISALGQVADVRKTITMDLKDTGNRIYLVGETRNELGGSHYAAVRHIEGGAIPKVDFVAAPTVFRALHAAIDAGLVRSCHDLSEGGLAVAAAEMAFAGGFGMHLSLKPLAEQTGISNPAVLLFSESPTRFLVEVAPVNELAFLATMRRAATGHTAEVDGGSGLGGIGSGGLDDVPCVALGDVVAKTELVIEGPNGRRAISSGIAALKHAWQAPLNWD